MSKAASGRRVYDNFYRVPRAGQIRCSDGGGPFGFDIQVACAFEEVVERYAPDVIAETGCFLGDTTEYLARAYPSLPVVTCDIDKAHCDFATARLAQHNRVEVHRTSGESLVRSTQERFHRPIYFLDAHWYADWPLRRELSSIRRGIAFVHDFNIDHSRFSYDAYGGVDCGPRLIQECVNSDRYWVVDIRGAGTLPVLQVGRRCGVAVIGFGDDALATLESATLLEAVPNDGRPVSPFLNWEEYPG